MEIKEYLEPWLTIQALEFDRAQKEVQQIIDVLGILKPSEGPEIIIESTPNGRPNPWYEALKRNNET